MVVGLRTTRPPTNCKIIVPVDTSIMMLLSHPIVAQKRPAMNHHAGTTSQKVASFTTIHEATDRDVKKLDNTVTIAISGASLCYFGQ